MIRPLTSDDLDAFFALRHESLVEAPLAFAASPEDDIRHAPEGTVFGAFDGLSLVGILGLRREPKRKAAHRMHLWGMYVTPSHRGRGLGGKLLAAAIARARETPGVRVLELGVTDAAPAARSLYERAGFVCWGTRPDALRDGERGVSEHHMLLPMSPSVISIQKEDS